MCGSTPGVPVGDFDCQMQGAVNVSLLFQAVDQALTPFSAGQASMPVYAGVAPQDTHVLQQFLSAAVSQCNDLLVHDWISKTVFKQQITKVVHIDKLGGGRTQVGVLDGITQLNQRTGAQ